MTGPGTPRRAEARASDWGPGAPVARSGLVLCTVPALVTPCPELSSPHCGTQCAGAGGGGGASLFKDRLRVSPMRP
jgi:hypothetical protein